MKKITEQDLHGVGLIVVGDQAVPMTSPPDEAADDDSWWGYGVAQLGYSKTFEAQSEVLARKSAVHLFRAGHAFFLLRQRNKEEGTWMALLKDKGLAYSTVLQAIQLYERAGSEDAIEGLTITEAKEKYKIVKPRVNPPAAPTPNSPVQAARRRSPLRLSRQSSAGRNDDGDDSEEEESESFQDGDDNQEQDGEPQPAIIKDEDLKREWMEGRLTQRADRLRLAALVLVDSLDGEEAVDWKPPLEVCRDILTKFDHLEPETLPFDAHN